MGKPRRMYVQPLCRNNHSIKHISFLVDQKKSFNSFIEIFPVAMPFTHLTHFAFSRTVLAGGTCSYSVHPKMTHGLWCYLTSPPKFARNTSILFYLAFIIFLLL